jgi:hypothetical protein
MQPADQRHCLDVFEALLRSGQQDPAMLQAALIHDCGKGTLSGATVRTWHRVAYVLLHPLTPFLEAASRLSPGIGAIRHHAALTLVLARSHGASAELVALLEQIEGLRPLDERGRALKRADDRA